MNTLREIIYEDVREGELFEKLDRNWVRCFACGHCCKIPEGQPGVCGKTAGLRYVYAGNLPGRVRDWENTRCPNCRELLIGRHGYLITGYFLTSQGCCPSRGASIPGRWDPAFRGQITDRPFVPLVPHPSAFLALDF